MGLKGWGRRAVNRALLPLDLKVDHVREEKRFVPAMRHYQLLDGDTHIEFDFWIYNRSAHQWYDEWFYGADYPTWELREYRELLRDGDRVLEIGCHHGFLTMMIQSLIGESGSIVAVDANPENCIVAAAQANLNRLGTRITCVHGAVSSDGGEKEICYRTNSRVLSNATGGHTVKVPGTTGDELDQQFGPFDVLKVDVEGLECEVLEGCREMLKRRPRLILEVHPQLMVEYKYEGSVEKLCEMVGTEHYCGTIVVRPNFRERLAFTPENVPRSSVSNLHLFPVDPH